MMRYDVMKIEIFLEYFVNDRREKSRWTDRWYRRENIQKRRIDRWRHVSLKF